MISAAFPLGYETVSWLARSDSHFTRFADTLGARLLGRDPGTVAAHGVWVMPSDTTTTHPSSALLDVVMVEEDASVSAEIIFEIRRLSGLTWDELATVFGVSRRSLHHWANGKPISAANEDRVQRVLATLQEIDRGEAHRNRALLMAPSPEGGLVIDLLRRGDFEAVERLVQAGPGRSLPGGRLPPKLLRHVGHRRQRSSSVLATMTLRSTLRAVHACRDSPPAAPVESGMMAWTTMTSSASTIF